MRAVLMRRVIPSLALAALLAACGGDGGPSSPPVVVGAISVSSGDNGTCAVGGAGGLACWGAVPDGTPEDTALVGADLLGATTIAVPIDLIAIALARDPFGGNSGCVVGSDHQVYCWGNLFDGDIGVGLGAGPTALAGATGAGSVAVDRSTLCITRTDRAVRCFGAFVGGGRGTDSVDVSDAGPHFSLTATGLSPAQAAFGTALGFQSGCAIRTDSLVACWGTRHRGQLGGAVADSTQDCGAASPPWCQRGPAVVAGGQKYRQVATQVDHVCGTRISGGVDCWGRVFGASTVGGWLTPCVSAADCVNTPTPVTLPGTAIRVVVGGEHACALLSSGAVYCWGDNSHGQLGRPGASSATPVLVSGGIVFVTLSAGVTHTCGIEAGTGAVGCWGENGAGQLGDGTTTDRDHPVAVVVAQ